MKAKSATGNDVDRGWAWLVLIAVYSGILILSTSVFTAGVIYVALLEYYNEDAAKTSIIGALNSGLLGLMGPFASLVMNKFSCRVSMFVGGVMLSLSYVLSAFVDSVDVLILVLGIIGGTGNSLVSSPFSVVLVYYFEKRRDFFIAISTALIGVAMNAASPVALYFLETYGLKGTFFMTGGLCANLCVCAVVCRPSSKEIQLKKTADSKRCELEALTISGEKRTWKSKFSDFNLDLLTNIPFLALLISTMTWNFMLSICLIHFPNYVVTKGLATSEITVIMTVFSITNTTGRFLGALTVNQHKIYTITIHILALGCGGVLTLSFPFYSRLASSAYVYAGLAGLFTGIPNSLMTAITMNLVGVDKIASAHGLEYFFSGLGYVTGPPIAGLLYERTQSYENSFTMSAAVMLLGSLVAIVTYISIRRQGQTRNENKGLRVEEEITMFSEKE